MKCKEQRKKEKNKEWKKKKMGWKSKASHTITYKEENSENGGQLERSGPFYRNQLLLISNYSHKKYRSGGARFHNVSRKARNLDSYMTSTNFKMQAN